MTTVLPEPVGDEPSRIRVNVVKFAPGARNAWHAHANGQTLHVTEGYGRVQSRGDDIVTLGPGDTAPHPTGSGQGDDHRTYWRFAQFAGDCAPWRPGACGVPAGRARSGNA